ncbi:hypothetical protein H7849_22640 [Alloacidobacterium dinghuense]|uniref:Uncharacterized protein n=1 Tax=Alloacidobacterium dinghuense TaxID=2763107 RepID=A0A7G8BGY2_9BACT|nr:hypothetical protein [Alloacidobacterium dinghuense]QNI31802.1 hypothetical protein H7849_22640 [Alloacidobacterium dinghuense]
MSTTHIQTAIVNFRQFVKRFQYAGIAFALSLFSVYPLHVLAQDSHSHATTHQQPTPAAQSQASALINIVRQSTERFKDVSVAEAEGYSLQFGCVSGPDSGAMGLHFVNSLLVNRGELDPTRPQIVIYEPTPNGGLQLIGADFLVLADAWDKKNPGPPELMGQLFHYFESPNRFGLPAFYTLHVWAWKDNPNGAFVNWHPNVSCEQFGGKNP